MHRLRFLPDNFAVYFMVSIGIGLAALPTVALAQEYIPPQRGLPGRREGGGTRGDCLSSRQRLTALMPDTNFGKTIAEYPTFFWYIPDVQPEAAEFVLLDENDNELYRTSFRVTGDSGVISLSLPENAGMPPLEVGKDYHWYFSLVCDEIDRSGDAYTEGWIQRVAPDAALVARLETAAASDRPAIYAAAGIWHDALTSLADLRRAHPQNSSFVRGWRTLLNSVELANVADQPFVPCCEADGPQPVSINPRISP
jgi:hypothetical protein